MLMLLRCIRSVSHQLGRASSAVILTSFISTDVFSFEDITSHLLKMLETGSTLVSRERKQDEHRSHRKFSVEVALCLHELYSKASSWSTVLDIFEKYLLEFVPKSLQNMTPKASFNVNSNLLIQATSQMSKVMLESSFGILLFLRYLVNVGVQVSRVIFRKFCCCLVYDMSHYFLLNSGCSSCHGLIIWHKFRSVLALNLSSLFLSLYLYIYIYIYIYLRKNVNLISQSCTETLFST